MKQVIWSENSYAAPGGYGINAYTDGAAMLKGKFLADGLKMARAIGKLMAENGLPLKEAHKNQGGIAVSGEVYAEYRSRTRPEWGVLVEFGSSSLRGMGLCRAGDGLMILVQFSRWRSNENSRKGCARLIVGENFYVCPHDDAATMAREIFSHFESQMARHAQKV